MPCPWCRVINVAQVPLFHAANPAGLVLGWSAIVISVAGAAWAIRSSAREGVGDVMTSSVLPVANTVVVSFFAGVALVWRTTAATRPRR